MEKVSIETDKMKEQGEEIQKIASDLSELFDNMYSKLLLVHEDSIWSSESATGSAHRFVENVSQDKKNNFTLCKNLDKMGKTISHYGESISSSADTNIRR